MRFDATCTCGKRGYTTKRTARRVRNAMGDSGLHIYRCPASDLLHLGHQIPGSTRDDYRKDTP